MARTTGYRARNAVNRVGMRYHGLLVLGQAPNKPGDSNAQWLCRCDCGREVIVSGKHIASKLDCGSHPSPTFQDLSGQKFGRLFVHERMPSDGGKTMWLCECDCGDIVVVGASHLKEGVTQSCGCLQRERTSASGKISNRKHGLHRHPLYRILGGMKSRCYNKSDKGYHCYGGRGITICDEWLKNPKAFIEWGLSNGWVRGLSIERKEVNGNYEPGNCRFATAKEQACNKRNNIFIELDGVRRTISEWAVHTGIASQYLIGARIKSGWSPRDAVFTPPLILHL